MRVISFDPGANCVGLSSFKGGELGTGLLRLVPKDQGYQAYKRKWSSRAEENLVRNLLDFLGKSTWGWRALEADMAVIELNTFLYCKAVSFAFATWLKTHNPACVIHFVHPPSISKFYGIGNLTRPQRKARIRDLVFQRTPKLEQLWKEEKLSQDELDSVLNIFYIQERKSAKNLPLPCPHWSCT